MPFTPHCDKLRQESGFRTKSRKTHPGQNFRIFGIDDQLEATSEVSEDPCGADVDVQPVQETDAESAGVADVEPENSAQSRSLQTAGEGASRFVMG